MALAAQDLAERLARRAGGARHRLDRHASPGKIHNLSVECLAKLSAIPLDMLGAGQGRGMTGRAGAGVRRRHCISDRTAQGTPQTHSRTCASARLPDAPGAPLRWRQRHSQGRDHGADDLDLRALLKPGGHGLAPPVRQQVDDLTTSRSTTMPPSLSPRRQEKSSIPITRAGGGVSVSGSPRTPAHCSARPTDRTGGQMRVLTAR